MISRLLTPITARRQILQRNERRYWAGMRVRGSSGTVIVAVVEERRLLPAFGSTVLVALNQSKTDTQVHSVVSPRCELTRHVGASDIPAFTPANLVLDLATPVGCKAELTWCSLTRPKTVAHPRTNPAGLLSWKELRQPVCHTSSK